MNLSLSPKKPTSYSIEDLSFSMQNKDFSCLSQIEKDLKLFKEIEEKVYKITNKCEEALNCFLLLASTLLFISAGFTTGTLQIFATILGSIIIFSVFSFWNQIYKSTMKLIPLFFKYLREDDFNTPLSLLDKLKDNYSRYSVCEWNHSNSYTFRLVSCFKDERSVCLVSTVREKTISRSFTDFDKQVEKYRKEFEEEALIYNRQFVESLVYQEERIEQAREIKNLLVSI